ncbi:hypothetical protein MATL_G00255950 [Megalops atlanticus]|uniref:Uncharacterized protein n=1 Tax=Megalops atlanticus TaxID=7932 RepID=A0A9D3PEC7_MEGAT|nr:hypothetical protein MATL_G00255950 [Megalops atlanticus]
MSRPLLILLLSTGALLITTEAQQSFHTLPQLHKKTINLAIQHANKDAQKHMNYHGVLQFQEDPPGHIYANIILRETTCDKTDIHEHRTECTIPQSKPYINCVVCCRRAGTELQEPFIDCIRHKEVSSETTEQSPQSSTESKMSRPLLILLLSTGALLITTEAQQSFHTLPQLHKKTINLAIRHANKDAQQHMNYHGVLQFQEDPPGYIYANIILRETTCDKTDVHEHRTECTVPQSKPYINCVVCCRRAGTELQEPFIDCIRHKEVSSRKEIREKSCSQLKSPPPGSSSEPGINRDSPIPAQVTQRDTEDPPGHIFMNALLRETTCDKTDVHEHRTEGKPYINCVVCCERSGTKLQNAFIDCIQHKDMKKRVNLWKQNDFHRPDTRLRSRKTCLARWASVSAGSMYHAVAALSAPAPNPRHSQLSPRAPPPAEPAAP